jgi:hypothetical protein
MPGSTIASRHFHKYQTLTDYYFLNFEESFRNLDNPSKLIFYPKCVCTASKNASFCPEETANVAPFCNTT